MIQIQNTKKPPQNIISQLVNLFNNGELVKADKLSRNLIKQYPDSYIVWNILGAVNKSLGKLSKSQNAFEKVTKLNPSYPDGFNNLGVVLNDREKFQAAEKACLNAIKLKPDYAIAYYNLGNSLKEQQKLDQAVEAFNKAISLKPDYVDAYNNLGIIFMSRGKLKEALHTFTDALQKKPNFSKAHFNIGNIFKEQRDLEKAIVSYKTAIKLNPRYAEAYFNMGNALNAQGMPNAAIDAFKQAVEVNPSFAEAFFNLGNVLYDQSELENAVAAFNRVISIKPSHVNARINLGNALKKLGRLNEALATFNKVRSIDRENAHVYYSLGNIFREMGKKKEALENYKKQLRYKADDPVASHMIASLEGKNIDTAPKEYVERLFDDFANQFEKSLVSELEYQLPKVVVEMVRKNHIEGSIGAILDLGCGTGLLGSELKNGSERLEGVDISASMLKQAENKNIYHKLYQSEITEYLSSACLDFDYIISLDVFIYVGNLSQVFQLIKSKSQRSVKFVFSTEHTEKEGFQLEKTGRFSHSKGYIQKLCREYDYKITHFSKINLRKESGEILIGGLYVLEFL